MAGVDDNLVIDVGTAVVASRSVGGPCRDVSFIALMIKLHFSLDFNFSISKTEIDLVIFELNQTLI
jgi:hypothetical protein